MERLTPLPPDPLPVNSSAPLGAGLPTKPLFQSKTARGGAMAFLLAVYAPLLVLLGVVFQFFGVPIDPSAWTGFLDDGVITGAEWFQVARDAMLALLSLMIIKGRKEAQQAIEGIFGRKHAS